MTRRTPDESVCAKNLVRGRRVAPSVWRIRESVGRAGLYFVSPAYANLYVLACEIIAVYFGVWRQLLSQRVTRCAHPAFLPPLFSKVAQKFYGVVFH